MVRRIRWSFVTKRRIRSKVLMIVPLLILQLFASTVVMTTPDAKYNIPEEPLSYGNHAISYTSHDPIAITGSSNFHATAAVEGWSGDGSESNPYRIEDYSITADGGNLIRIQDTSVHFVICNNQLDGGNTAIYNEAAIYLRNAHNAIISYNTITYCSLGVKLVSSNNILIIDNVISNQVSDATWFDGDGIEITYGSGITIYRNTINSNEEIGLKIYGASDTDIFANTVRYNGHIGVDIDDCTDLRVLSNYVADNDYGIGGETDNAIIQSNTMEDNTNEGLFLTDGANNRIRWNNLVGQSPQIREWSSSTNTFNSNYYSDWTGSPSTYSIPQDSSDSNPLSSSHTATPAAVTYPNGGEVVSGTATVTWSSASDSHSHSFNYSVACSSDGGAVWTVLAEGLSGTSYSWDTTQFDDETYEIRVISMCSEGLYKEDRSNAVFNVHNTLPSPSIQYPNGGEMLNETVIVDWVDVIDPFTHDVAYDLYISDNGGSSWSILSSNLDTSSYEWDTTAFANGEYDLMVNVSCTAGATSIDVTNASFNVLNHYLLDPTITYPNGGEMILGVCDVQWTASIDTWSHNVTYSLYYSPDGGSMWFIIALGISDNTYPWNTTALVDGNLYMVRVVATCSEILTAEDSSDDVFTVHNTMSVPIVLYPNGGETLTNVTVVEWSTVTDSYGHDVTYSVYYSIDNGDWLLLAGSLIDTSYEWNTTHHVNGHTYEIRVVAECEYGLITVDQSNGQFTIRNAINNIAPTASVSFTPVAIYTGESILYHVDVGDLEDNWTNLTMRICFWRPSTWRNITIELTAASADYEYITSPTLYPYEYDIWIAVYDSDGAMVECYAGNFTLLNNLPVVSAVLLNSTCYWGLQFQIQISIDDIEDSWYHLWYDVCYYNPSGWVNRTEYPTSANSTLAFSTESLLVGEYSIWVKVFDRWGGCTETFAGTLTIQNNLPLCSIMLLNGTVTLYDHFWFSTNVSDVENSLGELDIFVCFYEVGMSWQNFTINLSEEYERIQAYSGMLGVGTYDIWLRVTDSHNATVESFGGTIVIEERVTTTTGSTTSTTTTSETSTTTETTSPTTSTTTDTTNPTGVMDTSLLIVIGIGITAGSVILFAIIWFTKRAGPSTGPTSGPGIELG